MLETGEQVAGVPIAARAEQLAEASHRWKHYPMIASRAGALALESWASAATPIGMGTEGTCLSRWH